MIKRSACLLSFAAALLLSACDVHEKIMGDKANSGATSPNVYDYGTQTKNDDYVQREDNKDEQSVESANDYVLTQPVQTTEPQKTAESAAETKQAQAPITDYQPPVAEPDDVLLVPAKVAASEPKPAIVPPPTEDIIVAKGDTIYSLAKNHNVPLRDFIDANNLAAPYTISVGQQLKVPGARVHTVAAGETLYSISRAYSVDVNSLAAENNIDAPYALTVGQKLRLPATTVASQPQAVVSTPAKSDYTQEPAQADVKKTADTKVTATPTKISSNPSTPLPALSTTGKVVFKWPVNGKILSSFGVKDNGLYNDGINISAALGTAVGAAESGVVAYAGNELKGMGNLVIIQHSGGWMTVYAHMDVMNVQRGDKVAQGQKIGTVGQTGKVTEPQLHFEIRKGTKAYDPQKELKK